jgi:hypothetical protein
MAAARYSALAAAFALSTSAKTAVNIIPGATLPITIVEIGVSADEATGRVFVELFESTQAGAGTPGASSGAKQMGGFVAGDTTGPLATYGLKYSGEPTTLTVLKSWRFPAPGPFVIQFPLGREPQSLVSGSTKYKALGIRLTVDSGTPNSDSYIEWEE